MLSVLLPPLSVPPALIVTSIAADAVLTVTARVFGMIAVSPAAGNTVLPEQLQVLPAFQFPDAIAVHVEAAMTYGPTNGPPAPTGAAPAGLTDDVDESVTARARFNRPLTVWTTVPAGSADSARRFAITPFEADGSAARSSAAAPATSAADADVPEIDS